MTLLNSRQVLSFLSGRYGFPIILGIMTGLTLNLTTMPFFDGGCTIPASASGSAFTVSGSLRDLRSEGVQEARDVGDVGDQSHSDDDYQPRLVARDPEEMAQKLANAPKRVVRPRYYSTELGIKEKLFVAVVTTPGNLKEFGSVINQTLQRHVDRLIFFIDGNLESGTMAAKLPVVAFPDGQERVTQVLRVVQYLNETYSSSYDYFLLLSAMDKHSMAYVNGKVLFRSLSHVSISKPLHYGVPARRGSHYCSLERGVVLSSGLVGSVAGSGPWCLRQAMMSPAIHNQQQLNAIFGRCVLHATALPCSRMVQEEVYHSIRLSKNVSGSANAATHGSSAVAIITELDTLLAVDSKHGVHGRMAGIVPYTVTGVRLPQQLLLLHHYFLQMEVSRLKSSLEKTRAVIVSVQPKTLQRPSQTPWPVGSPSPHTPPTRFDVVPWHMFNASHEFTPDDLRNTRPLRGAHLRTLTSVVLAGGSHISNVTGGRLQLQRLNYGHYRLDPTRGVDYLLSLRFRDSATGTLTTKIVEASSSVTAAEFVSMPYMTESHEVVIVAPVQTHQRRDALDLIQRFVSSSFVPDNAQLLLALLQSPQATRDEFQEIRARCSAAGVAAGGRKKQKKRGGRGEGGGGSSGGAEGRVHCSSVLQPHRYHSAPQLHLIDQLVRRLGGGGSSGGALVLVVPVTAHFTADALNRVRLNTIPGWQVFSPVMFSLWHPGVVDASPAYASMDVKASVGHFGRHDYTAISFYVADYKKARKLASNLFPMMTSKPSASRRQQQRHYLSLYRLFLSFSNLHVLRAPEPQLKTSYVDISCPPRRRSSSNNKKNRDYFKSDEEYEEDATFENQLLHDLSLLMGDSTDDNNAAYYNYVVNQNDWHSGVTQGHSLTLNDLRGDGFCHDKLRDSFGTRAQLSKLVLDYDQSHGKISRL